VVVAMAFHLMLSFDLDQHFFDFTSILFALFALFVPDGERERLLPAVPRRIAPAVAVALGLAVLASVGPPGPLHRALFGSAMVLAWAPLGAFVVARAAGAARRAKGPWDVALRPPVGRAGAAVVVALVVLNGLTPYLELKTASAWNMYANLVTADGESNHFLVRRTLALTAGNEGPVTVLESDDPGLAAYVGSGWAVAWPQFRHHLAGRPEASVTFERFGVLQRATGAELGERLPWWRAKLLPFRALPLDRPPPCQSTWLPAR
jgi:hypothetical protein